MAFKVNQKYIAATLCEKRDELIQMCSGQCVLVKTLQKEEQNDQKLPNMLKTVEEAVYCFEALDIFLLQTIHKNFGREKQLFHYVLLYLFSPLKFLLQPPD